MAEREEFIVKQYAWANVGIDWESVFGGWGVYDGKQLAKNPWGIEISSFSIVQGVGLVSEERVVTTSIRDQAATASHGRIALAKAVPHFIRPT